MREITNKELNDLRFLDCLRETGVDNWIGWDEAWQLYRESTDSEEVED